jgi:hypothetical protein
MDHFPGVNCLECIECLRKYSLEEIWEKTGCDCHEEDGRLNCACGNTISFTLNLDINKNLELFIKKITDNFSDGIVRTCDITRDLLGPILITVTEDSCHLKFPSIEIKLSPKQLPKNDDCVVCYEESATQTVCNHTVCKKCYDQLSTCPLCRRSLNGYNMTIKI